MKKTGKNRFKALLDPISERLVVLAALLMFSMFAILAIHPFVILGISL
ncbi:MAG: hypothetical protein H8D24_01330 [Gammaproteobacteria bacterium]|uniref:Uncharacterized protein n=1 Tax=Candidatus Thiopontia autotrophica TaxID=2841688 RepID=A0A8J6P942_9GAMM|nr:hypothetical protein [Candidatus Thiopontia autotrophica]